MSTEATQGDVPHDKERIDAIETTADFPSDALQLGVDGDGATHHYSRIAAEVTVTTNGDVERRVDIEGRTLASWIAYVDGQRGWATLNYADSFGDVLREAIGGGA
ncbi:MAG: hypothetical protein ACI8XM_000939 [Haloarculaceae archaeon]|jgi:hypothetical protein